MTWSVHIRTGSCGTRTCPIDEDDAADLLKEIQKQLKKRQWGEVIRLEIEDKMDPKLLKILKQEFDVKEDDIYRINGPLDLTFLMKLYGMDGMDEYRYKPYQPAAGARHERGGGYFHTDPQRRYSSASSIHDV